MSDEEREEKRTVEDYLYDTNNRLFFLQEHADEMATQIRAFRSAAYEMHKEIARIGDIRGLS